MKPNFSKFMLQKCMKASCLCFFVLFTLINCGIAHSDDSNLVIDIDDDNLKFIQAQDHEKPENHLKEKRGIDLVYISPPDPQCKFQCSSYISSSSITQNPLTCTSKFCYTVTVAAGAVPLSNFDLVGLTLDPTLISSIDGSYVLFGSGILRFNATINAGSSLTRCINLNSYFQSYRSEMVVSSNQGSCILAIDVPSVVSDCPKNCIIDPDLTGRCAACDPICDNLNPKIAGNQLCNYNILKVAAPGGPPCTTTTVKPCVKSCPVDCKLGPLMTIPCVPNCAAPNLTLTYYYSTIVSPTNDGSACDPLKTPVTTTCGMPLSVFSKSCTQICTVDGYLNDPCSSGCAAGNPIPFTATATYPITIQTPGVLEAACPSITKTCSCIDCSLGPTPTSLGKCDALCTYYDGSYALGYRSAFFPVLTQARSAGTCMSASLMKCSRSCPCSYASVSTGACAITTTNTASIPWVATGVAVNGYYGGPAVCPVVAQAVCTSVVKPIDCTVQANCPSCTCTPTTGTDYQINTAFTCQQTTLTSAQNGGQACPTQPSPIQCNRYCPGCEYQPEICDCQYTSAIIPGSTLTTYVGYKTCTSPPVSPTQSNTILGGAVPINGCPALTSIHKQIGCTSTVRPTDCLYQYHTYGICTATSTATQVLPWIAMGTQSITYTESRANGAPSTCSFTVSTRSCSYDLYPVNCEQKAVCYNCEAKCKEGDIGVATTSESCTIFTLSTAMFGGSSCVPTIATSTTCSSKCTPTSDDNSGEGLFGSVDDVNAYFAQNSTGVSGSIGGRVVACNEIVLIDFNVAKDLVDPNGVCLTSRPVIFVGGNLIMSGKVYAGNGVVGGSCSEPNFVDCTLTCNTPIDGTCVKKRGISCPSINERLLKITSTLQQMMATGQFRSIPNKMASLSFGGTQIEVVNIDSSLLLSSYLPIINSIDISALLPNASIIFNVLGSTVRLMGQTLDIFSPYQSNIIWNFPQATVLDVSGMDLRGSIVAPTAALSGNGVIFGQVFVGSLNGDVGTTVSIMNVPYKGANFV